VQFGIANFVELGDNHTTTMDIIKTIDIK